MLEDNSYNRNNIVTPRDEIDFLEKEVFLKFALNKEHDKRANKKLFGYSDEQLEQLDKLYETGLHYLKDNVSLYQKSWDKIGREFFAYVKQETGYNRSYEEYICTVSPVTRGVASWNGNQIIRIWNQDEKHMKKMTAHELILTHYFSIYKNYYADRGLTDGQVRALAEIAAFALTSLTEQVKDWRPGNTEYRTNHNYPHIVKLQKELKEVFLQKENFDEYVKKGIELVRKYPNMSPRGGGERTLVDKLFGRRK